MNKKVSLKSLLLSLVVLTSLVVMTSWVFVPTAYAFDGREGQTVIIGKDEVVAEDLYIAGEYVIVDGTVKGDLLIAARSATINGVVEGDLWFVGNELELNGSVGDDLFFGGAAATLGSNASIEDDVFFGGYSFEARPGSQVGGAVLMGGYQGLLNGDIAGNLMAGANRVRVGGVVGGDASINVANPDNAPDVNPAIYNPQMPPVPYVPRGLTLGDQASIEGDLTYISHREIAIARERIKGIVEHQLPPVQSEVTERVRDTPVQMVAAWMFDNMRRLVSFVVVGLLLAWLLPAAFVQPAVELQRKPWPSLGWGLVILLIAPFIILIAIGVVVAIALVMGALTLGSLVGAVLSVGGAVILSAVAVYALVLSYLTKSAVAYLGGRYLLNRFRPEWAEKAVWPLLLGLVVLAGLFAIPFLGGLAEFFVMIFGLGAVFLIVRERFSPAAPLPVQAPAAAE
jgi:hypothetical protein